MHTGEKPAGVILCTICLLLPFGIRKHMRVHTGEKPAECTLCKVDLANAACASAATVSC